MCANCLEHFFFLSEELVSFVTTTNSPTDKPSEYVRLLANFYVYKSKFHDSMPVLRVFHTDLRSRYNINNYAPFMMVENADFKMQWLSCKNSAWPKPRREKSEKS